jgi:hypothetical protein
MSVSAVRRLLCWMMCWVMCATFPLSLLAAEPGSAMLRSKGGVWLNGKEAPESTAIFSGDLIETRPGSVANLEAQGSSVLVQSESVVSLGDNSLTLEHGSVSVGTSTEMRVKIHCLTVVPVADQWTQYDVTDVNGTVQVVAHKLDVNINQGSIKQGSIKDGPTKERPVLRKSSGENNTGSATVHEGQTASRDESEICGAAKIPGTAGGNPISTTKWIEIGGGGAGATILCILLCRGSGSSNVSPSNP